LSDNDRGPRCYFFLSYAREDEDEWVRRFYHDLSNEVRAYAGLSPGTEVGFLDTQSLDLGARWSDRLARELARCCTFVALISPRYVKSPWCGREWAVFADRLAQHTSSDGPPSALLPVNWLSTPTLPAVVGDHQLTDSSLPPQYLEKGLRRLSRLNNYEDPYLDVVEVLAKKIVRNAHADEVPRLVTPPAFTQVPSVFHPPVPAGRPIRSPATWPPDPGQPVAPGPVAPGPAMSAGPADQRICFVVAAPVDDDVRGFLASTGRDRRYYGPTPADWSPYLPELDMPLVEYARQVAEQEQFTAVVTDLAGLHSAVGAAQAGGSPVVLLVDLWVVYVDGPRRLLSQHSGDTFDDWPVTAVLVPANGTDAQTRSRHNELMAALRQVIGDRMRNSGAVISRTRISSHQEFRSDLQAVLEKVRNDGFRTRHPYHRPPGRPNPRPILRGP